MSGIRPERVATQLIDILSELIRKELRDPRIGFVTLTGATVSHDLRHAKVFVSVMGDDEARKQTLRALNGAVGAMRGEVTRQARLRIAPEIVFAYDDGIERGQRIFALLNDIEEDRKLNPILPDEETPEEA
ncbi:ribosome-binding factor A [Armatimonadota bacterium]|nr:ribosome-binding factor A [Armatimonadota bacterium]